MYGCSSVGFETGEPNLCEASSLVPYTLVLKILARLLYRYVAICRFWDRNKSVVFVLGRTQCEAH